MTEAVERETYETEQVGDQTEVTRSTTLAAAPPNRAANKLIQVVYFIAGAVMILIGIRFVLQLLGAAQGNAFVSFIYNLTEPLVAPFYGIFQTSVSYGAARLESESLVAIVVYGLVAWGIAQAIRLTK